MVTVKLKMSRGPLGRVNGMLNRGQAGRVSRLVLYINIVRACVVCADSRFDWLKKRFASSKTERKNGRAVDGKSDVEKK